LSRSPRLIKMINDLRAEIFLLRKVMLNSMDMARLSNKDHREMVKAIRKREAKKVESLVREHILRGKKFVLNEIKSGKISLDRYIFREKEMEEAK
jgi:DNA-binding GntR family transcriptional regulator